jgi:hypothetical protein
MGRDHGLGGGCLRVEVVHSWSALVPLLPPDAISTIKLTTPSQLLPLHRVSRAGRRCLTIRRGVAGRLFPRGKEGSALQITGGRMRILTVERELQAATHRYLIASDLSWRTLDIVQGHTLRWLVEICQSCNLRRTLFGQKFDSVDLQTALRAVCGAAAWKLTSWSWPPRCGHLPSRTAIPTCKPVQARDHP